MSALLELAAVSAGYGASDCVHDVSLTVDEGGVTALLGANGAGKSSILRAISGTIRRRGSIRFGGTAIGSLATEQIARCGIGHVPEGRGLFTNLTVRENLELGAIFRRDRAVVSDDLARICGYFPILAQRFGQAAGLLSGGEQQMLAIARTLMMRPRLLLLDEPSFGLAPLVVRDLFGILAQVKREERIAILLVEQNAALALPIADTACLVETGRIVRSGTVAELVRDDALRNAYLGA